MMMLRARRETSLAAGAAVSVGLVDWRKFWVTGCMRTALRRLPERACWAKNSAGSERERHELELGDQREVVGGGLSQFVAQRAAALGPQVTAYENTVQRSDGHRSGERVRESSGATESRWY